MDMNQLPEAYRQMFSDYAKANHQSEFTAFSNLMDFIQLKEAAFQNVRIIIEKPRGYLQEDAGENALEVLQIYMDTFAEENIGATVYGYYNPDRLDCLLLDIEYDREMPVWDILPLFRYQIPSMDILEGESLGLFYIEDIQGVMTEKAKELYNWFLDPDREDDGFGKAGYYEPLYPDMEDEEEFFDDDDALGEEEDFSDNEDFFGEELDFLDDEELPEEE